MSQMSKEIVLLKYGSGNDALRAAVHDMIVQKQVNEN